MCKQEHTPLRPVRLKNGDLAFKCNCGQFHPFERMQPNEMDTSTTIPKEQVEEANATEKTPVSAPAGEKFKKGRWGMTH